MSLINEALKQAGQTGVNAVPSASPRAVGVLRPATTSNSSRPLLLILLPVALIAALAMAYLVFKQAWSNAPQPVSVANNRPTAAAKPAEDWFQPMTPAAKSAPAPIATTPSVPATAVPVAPSSPATPGVASVSDSAGAPTAPSVSAPAATPVPAAPAMSLAAAAAAAPATPPPPAFRLQGITFSASAPSALINGRTVFVGDEVDGAMVTRIDQRSVTLAVEGRTQVLRMR
jgi:hypothetical protein